MTNWCSQTPILPSGPIICPDDKPCINQTCAQNAANKFNQAMWAAINKACTDYTYAQQDRGEALNVCIRAYNACIANGNPPASCQSAKDSCDASAEATFQATVSGINSTFETAKTNATSQYYLDMQACCMPCPPPPPSGL